MKKSSQLLSLFSHLPEWMRVLCISGVALLADLSILIGLTEWGRVYYLASAAISFLIGLIINYALSASIGYSTREQTRTWRGFFIFSIIGICGLGISQVAVWIFTEWIGFYYVISKFIGVVFVFFWNYQMRKWLVFSEKFSSGQNILKRCLDYVIRQKTALILVLGICTLQLTLAMTLFHHVRLDGRDPFAHVVVSPKDSTEYLHLAQQIKEGNGYLRTNVSAPKPELFRVPGYPLFLAGILSVSSHPFAIPFAQALLVILTCVILYFLGRNLISSRAGIVFAILYFLTPSVFHLSLLALSETLFQFVLAIWLFYLYKWIQVGTRIVIPSLVLGSLTGLLAYIRSSALLLAPFLFVIIVLILLLDRKDPMATKSANRAWGGKLALFMVSCVLVITPWILRNRFVSGQAIFSSISTYNVFYYNLTDFDATHRSLSQTQALTEHLTQIGLTVATADRNDPEVLRRMGTFTKEFLASNAVEYTLFHLKKSLLFFFQSDAKSFYVFLWSSVLNRGAYADPSLTPLLLAHQWHELSLGVFSNPREIVFLIERFVWLLLLTLSTISLFLTPRIHRKTLFLLYSIMWYFALTTGPVLMSRYRLPSVPSALLLSLFSCHLALLHHPRLNRSHPSSKVFHASTT